MAAAHGIQTLLHVSPDAEAEARLQLDLEIMDSFGTPVPWGDLHVHHGRKMHVYVVHQVSFTPAQLKLEMIYQHTAFLFLLTSNACRSLNSSSTLILMTTKT